MFVQMPDRHDNMYWGFVRIQVERILIHLESMEDSVRSAGLNPDDHLDARLPRYFQLYRQWEAETFHGNPARMDKNQSDADQKKKVLKIRLLILEELQGAQHEAEMDIEQDEEARRGIMQRWEEYMEGFREMRDDDRAEIGVMVLRFWGPISTVIHALDSIV
ncbi:MAG: hypothetical protein Q9220_005175 [cf. Caloplaca sp. 1 TL-2023]